jgi:hypothetical protein
MKTLRNTVKTATIATVLLLTSVMMVNLPVDAQLQWQEGGSQPLPSGVTPDVTVKTKAYLSFRPNPVGLNQIFLVNMWITPALHVSRYLKGYKVTIQKPNGDTDVITMDSYRGDATAWFEYIADQEGVWKLKFEFPGGYFPPGIYTVYGGAFVGPQNVTFTQSCYYEPSSTDWQELVVQKDTVYSWQPSPLPTDYWTRPVSPENREWWPILGNYPATGVVGGGADWPANTNKYMSNYNFVPYVQGPNSAHLVWKRQGAIGGLIGGTMKTISFTAGGGNPTIIYAGRCYQTLTKVMPDGTVKSVWQCYDLRTGEVYWERTGVTQVPTMIFYGHEAQAAVPGAGGFADIPLGGYAGKLLVELMYIGSGRIIRYDPWTGAVSFNFSISPLTTGVYYNTYPFFLSVQNLGASVPINQRYRLINWTLFAKHVGTGYQYQYSLGVLNNVSWPWSSLPSTIDFEAGIAASVSAITNPATGAYYGTWAQAASLKSGELLWNKTYPETLYSGSCVVADHGKVAFVTMDGYWVGLNLADGNVAWKSEEMDYPWDSPGFGAYAVASAYGLFYRFAYSGVYAFNWTNGKRVWKFEAPANPYETPYIGSNGTTVYSFNAGGLVADGKLYVSNTEHTPTQPITRGWRLFCLNATTGKCIWNITGSMTPGAVADGYLVASNSYDGYTYCFGKGKSSTTVSASPKASTKGSQVLIEGTVLDMSPAQPGTPCVAKESMTVWMEYLHMQKPCPSDVKGVPVVLTAIKSDGKVIDLGTVTTNGFYGTFSFAWTPEEEGTYTIIACFMGDESYGSSAAATAITVGPAPPEPETPEYPTPTDYTPILAGLAIAIIAVAILVIYAIITVRKLRK